MTPKEKAIELYEFYLFYRINDKPQLYLNDASAKCFATRCVDEIINVLKIYGITVLDGLSIKEYWNEVKQEINKL